MSPDDVREQLSAYLDGELGEAERRAVEDALERDPDLRAELADLRHTVGLVREMPRLSAPAGFRQRVEAALAEGALTAPQPPRPRRWLRPAVLAAAACLAVAVVIVVVSRRPDIRPSARTLDHERKQALPAADAEADGALEEELTAAGDLAGGKASAPSRARREERTLRSDGRGAAGAGVDKLKGGAVDLAEAAQAAVAATRPKAAPAALRPAIERSKAPHATAMAKKAGRARPKALKTKDERFASHIDADFFAGGARQEAERDALAVAEGELMDAIQSDHPAPSAATGPPRAVRAHNGLHAEARPDVREVELVYVDLEHTLANVRAVLEEANLSYVVQPVGGWRFVIESGMPEAEAAALVARLASPAKGSGQRGAATPAAPEPPAKPAARPARTVRLVLRFVRADVPDAGQASPAQRDTSER